MRMKLTLNGNQARNGQEVGAPLKVHKKPVFGICGDTIVRRLSNLPCWKLPKGHPHEIKKRFFPTANIKNRIFFSGKS